MGSLETMKLQDLSGLTNNDPIYRYLGIVDKLITEKDLGQLNRSLSQEQLTDALWFYLGHPVQNSTVQDSQIEQLENYLQQNNEPIFLEIVFKLKQKKSNLQQKGFKETITEDVDNHGIRCVLMYLIANLDTFKTQYEWNKNKIVVKHQGDAPNC